MALSEEDKETMRRTNAALNQYSGGLFARLTSSRPAPARRAAQQPTSRRRSRCPECGHAMKRLPGYPEALGRGTREIWLCDTGGCPVLNVTVERV